MGAGTLASCALGKAPPGRNGETIGRAAVAAQPMVSYSERVIR